MNTVLRTVALHIDVKTPGKPTRESRVLQQPVLFMLYVFCCSFSELFIKDKTKLMYSAQ